MSTTTSYTQPALIGGLVLGVLSALPVVYLGNCCCLWVVSGGLVAAYVLQANQRAPITAADGALAGLLAGLAGAVIYSLLSIPIDIVVGPWEGRFAQRLMETTNNPQIQEMLRNNLEQSASLGFAGIVLRRFGMLLFMLVFGGAFATVGGVVGALLFKKAPVPTPAE